MKSLFCTLTSFILLSGIFLISGCLKDHCTHSSQYKVFSPVYSSLNTIRDAVRSGPAQPVRQTGKIFYHDGYLFLNELNKGIHVIDDRNPAAPENVAFIYIPGNIDMAANGNMLYADSYGDMVAMDISDPEQVKVTDRIDDVFPIRYYYYGFRDLPQTKGIITGFTSKDTVIKNDCNMQVSQGGVFYDQSADKAYVLYAALSNSSQPSVNPGGGNVGGSLARFAMLDHFLYAVNNDTLSLYDLSRPSNPVPAGRSGLGMPVETIFPYQSYLFIGTSTGVLIYDASQPGNPQFKSRFMHVYACDPVVVQNGFAYATLSVTSRCRAATTNELDVINLSNINAPFLERSMPLTQPGGLAIDGNKLFVCDGSEGIRCIDVSNTSQPVLKTTIKGIQANDVIAFNGILIAVAKDGLYQYDYHDFSHPALLGRINILSE